jgi:hypothetical protein
MDPEGTKFLLAKLKLVSVWSKLIFLKKINLAR